MSCCCCGWSPFRYFEPDLVTRMPGTWYRVYGIARSVFSSNLLLVYILLFICQDAERATSSRFLSRCCFISYKVLLTTYSVFWTVYWPVEDNVDDAYLFVTYWTFYTTAIYFLISTITACMMKARECKPKVVAGPVGGEHGTDGGYPLSSCARFLLGFQVFTWNVACIGSIVVVVVFWTSLYEGGALTSTDINAHALIAVIMVFDQLFVATKFERKQMWAVFAYSATYITWNILWYVLGPESEKVIYNPLDWGSDIDGAIVFAVVIIFVLVPICGFIHYGVYRLRECIFASVGKSETPPPNDVESGRVVVLGTS